MGFLGMFNYDKPGRGVDKDAPRKRGFFLFFEVFFRKFWRLNTLSMAYTLSAIPAFLVYYYVALYMQGLLGMLEDPSLANLLSVFAALFLVCFLGAGPGSMGQAYVLRNFAREEHSWPWSDFWEKAKENFWKSVLFFFIDIVALVVLTSGAVLYLKHGNLMPLPPILTTAFGFLLLFALFTYFMMHFFLYTLTVTMDMKAGALLKTAFQLTLLKLPVCVVISLASLAMFSFFFSLVIYANIGFIMLFPLIGFSATAFVYTFYSTSVMDKILDERQYAQKMI